MSQGIINHAINSAEPDSFDPRTISVLNNTEMFVFIQYCQRTPLNSALRSPGKQLDYKCQAIGCTGKTYAQNFNYKESSV